MKPGRLTLTIDKGATFRQRVTWKAPTGEDGALEGIDLTNWAARSQFRINGQAVLTFDSEADEDGTITLGADGSIELLADAETVSSAPAGSGAWSLEVTPSSGDRVVLLKGPLTILSEITR